MNWDTPSVVGQNGLGLYGSEGPPVVGRHYPGLAQATILSFFWCSIVFCPCCFCCHPYHPCPMDDFPKPYPSSCSCSPLSPPGVHLGDSRVAIILPRLLFFFGPTTQRIMRPRALCAAPALGVGVGIFGIVVVPGHPPHESQRPSIKLKMASRAFAYYMSFATTSSRPMRYTTQSTTTVTPKSSFN